MMGVPIDRQRAGLSNRSVWLGAMMVDSDKEKGSSPLSIGIGKEIDAALGDVIRGLLKRPAEEAGNLLADSIGILGDRVRRKRLLNAQLGLEETRALLDKGKVDLRDITPPAEEELQLVLDGMSLTGDANIRKLWSGLLASALSPAGPNSIERPIISAISALTPADARIIEFAAFVTKENRAIESDAKASAGVIGHGLMSLGDADRVEKAREAMGERLSAFIQNAMQMEHDFQLQEISSHPDWLDNMERLGILKAKLGSFRRKSPPSFTRRGLDVGALVDYFQGQIEEAQALALGGLDADFLFQLDAKSKKIKLGIEFTRFGERLCQSCGLF